ncbi:ABC transporter ATP-binding protein [Paenibacillus donghaensis]|uniref:ABC transporter n=1 Tax=Paenibacillus donghaensis TaxID=414771 RepID=A0A2Z2KLZ7_9BACL|nr:ABC transporter ATP-binding protein [Paenibacillus donghaensis]ASA23529.1 ABC transporter [Paenibacillus donghaensis]
MNVIDLIDITKKYGSFRGVLDLNLQVKQGEIFGFIGPNGAGKSTTIRMLMGLLSPDRGQVRVLGQLLDRERPQLRRKIGYLPSEIMLYPGLSGREILAFAAAAHGMKLDAREVKTYAERLDWNPDRKIRTYSLGNRKKLGIVLSLLHHPELIVLDEPTSGLDPLIQNEFFSLLKERSSEEGVTVFFSTHVLSEVEKVCQRVAFIKEGQLNRISDIGELTDSGDHLISVVFMEDGDMTELYKLRELDEHVLYDGQHHRLRTGNRLQQTLTALSQLPLKAITVRRPTIEEMFMEDYRKGEVKQA